ncbi:MAG: TonB-dependent receptor, partial [Gammaproteobacteria bacterium]|nr:TonB-dependent receptor [Gammaproteobacteria bacterium]
MLVSTVSGAQAVLEEVVVTAQKREQSIQDVPISITAISGENLQANIVQDVYDLRATVPALEVRGVDPPSQGAAFAIRGLGSSVFNMGFEPTVGTFIDGVYISRSGLVASSDLLDLDRVEVLKGPQGTLFGKNTTGGVVHFITNQPSFDEVEGSAEVTYQEYDQVRVRGVINVPVQDNFAARIAASWHNGDGYLDNANGEDLNDRDRFTIRGQLMWEPSADLNIRVIADYSEVDENCCWPVRNSNNPLNPLVNAPLAAAVGSNVIDPPDVNDLRVAANGDLIFDAEDFGISGEINWQLGDITVTSITAYRDYQDLNTKDNDFTGVDILTNTDTLPEVSIVSEELRIAGVSEDIGIGRSLDWVVGFYYASEKVRRTREFVWGPQITSFPFFAPGLFGNIPGRAFYDEFSQEVDTIAGFGHITIDLNDKLSLTGGVRYTNDDKNASHRGQTGNAMAPFNNLPLAVVHDFDAKREDSEATGTASIQYRVTDDVMGFFTYSRGYKSGGISLNRDAAGNALGFGHPVFGCPPGGTPVPASPFCAFPPGDPTFEPEFADHYEIGFKSTLFNNRMRLN